MTYKLEASMNSLGNCYDNAVTESFFHLLKSKRIRRKTYATLEKARQDELGYIQLFYNPKRKHGRNGIAITGRLRTKAKIEGSRYLENLSLIKKDFESSLLFGMISGIFENFKYIFGTFVE
jgi:hypothetical protein